MLIVILAWTLIGLLFWNTLGRLIIRLNTSDWVLVSALILSGPLGWTMLLLHWH